METIRGDAAPHILVVSCDEESGRSLTDQLRKGGLRNLTPVTDGRLAVLCALRQHYSLAVVETCLEGMDGYEVAERLISLPGHPEGVPVVLISAEGNGVPEMQARLLKTAGLLIRPFEPAELVAKVEEALGALVLT